MRIERTKHEKGHGKRAPDVTCFWLPLSCMLMDSYIIFISVLTGKPVVERRKKYIHSFHYEYIDCPGRKKKVALVQRVRLLVVFI